MTAPTPLDRFRTVLAGATRAIAEDSEAEVVFASDASGQSPGKVARVVSPGPGLEPRLVAEARGCGRCTGVAAQASRSEASRDARPGGDSDARGSLRRAGTGAGRSARRPGDGRRKGQPQRSCGGARPAGRDHPGADCGRGPAGDRRGAAGPATADGRGAAARGKGGARTRCPMDRGKGRRRARRAGADDRRPGSIRDPVAPAARGPRTGRSTSRPTRSRTRGGRGPGRGGGPRRSRRRRNRGRGRRRRNGNALGGNGAGRWRGRERRQ